MSIPLTNGGFETPSVAAAPNLFSYGPAGSGWTWGGPGGICRNGGSFQVGDLPTPNGAQFAFLQHQGTVSQQFTVATAGSYVVAIRAAQRNGSAMPLAMTIDGASIGTFTPANDRTWHGFLTSSITLAAGTHTLAFSATAPGGADMTILFDEVRILTVAEATPPADPGIAIGINPYGFSFDNPDQACADAIRGNANFGSAIDAKGWPTGDFNFGLCGGENNSPGIGSTGVYTLWIDAYSASVAIDGQLVGSVGPVTRDTVSGLLTCKITITQDCRGNALVTGTRRLATDTTATGVRSIQAMLPIAPGSTTSHDRTEFTGRSFRAMVSPSGRPGFAFIRGLDLTLTNNFSYGDYLHPEQRTQYFLANPVTSAQLTNPNFPCLCRATVGADAWGGHMGIAVEHITRLANDCNTDLWYSFPDVCDASYITSALKRIFFGSRTMADGYAVEPFDSLQSSYAGAGVFPPLAGKVYLVWSNEILFNYGFPQATDNNQNALAEVAAGGSDLLWGDGSAGSGSDPTTAVLRRPMRKLIEIVDIAVGLVGQVNFGRKFRPVFDGQQGQASLMDNSFAYANRIAAQRGVPVSSLIWGAGGAWYIDPVQDTLDNSGPNFENLFTRGWAPNTSTAADRAVLDKYTSPGAAPVILTHYEGNTDTASVGARSDPRISTVTRANIEDCLAAGAKVLDVYATWVRPWNTMANVHDTASRTYLATLDAIQAHNAGPAGPVALLPIGSTPTVTLQSIAVTPTNQSITGPTQYAAAGTNTDGSVGSTAGGVWATTLPGATISATGLLAPPAQASTAKAGTVTCTVGNVVGTTGVTVPAASSTPTTPVAGDGSVAWFLSLLGLG